MSYRTENGDVIGYDATAPAEFPHDCAMTRNDCPNCGPWCDECGLPTGDPDSTLCECCWEDHRFEQDKDARRKPRR